MASTPIESFKDTFHGRWKIGDTIHAPVQQVDFDVFHARLLTTEGNIDASVLYDVAKKFVPEEYAKELSRDLEEYGAQLLKEKWSVGEIVAEIKALLVGEQSPPRGSDAPNERSEGREQSNVTYPVDEAALRLLESNEIAPGYQIRRLLGRGGMSSVFLAQQEVTGRVVAIKILRFELDGFLVARFKREIRVLAQLHHMGIVSILDTGMTNVGNPFLVTEFVDGHSIDVYISRLIVLKDAILIFSYMANAIGAAHKRGIIHRDLKPSNILVSADGRPKIIDFGIAKIIDPEFDADGTVSADFVGSVAYASPEQGFAKIDSRSDIYTLGVTMWVCIFQSFPYSVEGSLMEVLKRIWEEDPVLPTQVRWPASPALESLTAVLRKCLQKKPERRYQVISDLEDDLMRILEDKPLNEKSLIETEYLSGQKPVDNDRTPMDVELMIDDLIDHERMDNEPNDGAVMIELPRWDKSWVIMFVVTVASLIFGLVSTLVLLFRVHK